MSPTAPICGHADDRRKLHNKTASVKVFHLVTRPPTPSAACAKTAPTSMPACSRAGSALTPEWSRPVSVRGNRSQNADPKEKGLWEAFAIVALQKWLERY